MKNITEEDKIISEFMGGKYYPATDGKLECIVVDVWGKHKGVSAEELKKTDNYTYLNVNFSTSWDWLMPVVYKIEGDHSSGQTFEVRMNIDGTKILDCEFLEIIDVAGNDRKKNTYLAVVDFIKWYNEVNTDELPENIQTIMDSFDEDEDAYKECKRMKNLTEILGYTFDYGLDGEPHNIRKMDEEELLHWESKQLLEEMGLHCSLCEIKLHILNDEYKEKVRILTEKFNNL